VKESNGLLKQVNNKIAIIKKEFVTLLLIPFYLSSKLTKPYQFYDFNFKDNVLSYRRIDEGMLIKRWTNLDEKYGTEYYAQWSFFKQLNSDYLAAPFLNTRRAF